MTRLGRVVLLVVLATVAIGGQESSTASLGGVVVSPASGTPIRRATVTLSGIGAAGVRVAVTDDQGRFAFGGLPAGRFTLTAARVGYVTTAYGTTRRWRSPGVPLVLTAGQSLTGITLKMTKGGVITGRVTDPLGRALEDVWVGIAEYRTLNGQLTLTSIPINGGGVTSSSFMAASTDDRGIYRLYGIPPGTYAVSAYRLYGDPTRSYEPTTGADIDWSRTAASPAPPPAAPPVGYVPTYFPGTADPGNATTVTLAGDEERAGIDIQIDPVRFSTISGTVTGASGESMRGMTLFAVRVSSVTGGMSGGIPPIGTSDERGEFKLSGVPPGRFVILAQSRGLGAAPPVAPAGASAPPVALFGRAETTVDGADVSGVHVQMLPGITVTGRVVLEGGAPFPPDLAKAKVRVTAPPAPFGASMVIPPVDIAANGSFSIPGVGPGSYVLSLAPSFGETWMVKATVRGSRDLMTSAFEVAPGEPVDGVAVTITDRVTEIYGRVLDAAGRPAPDYYLLAFPVDRRLWSLGKDRLRPAVRPDSTGRYRVTGLPPGDYYLAVLPDMQPGDYADLTFLEMVVPAALRLTLGDGEKKTQDVRLSGGG